MIAQAEAYEKEQNPKLAAHYYITALERYKKLGHPNDIALCLRRMAQLCEKSAGFSEAMKFRNAERLVYESQLLALVDDGSTQSMIEPDITTPQAPKHLRDEELKALAYEKYAILCSPQAQSFEGVFLWMSRFSLQIGAGVPASEEHYSREAVSAACGADAQCTQRKVGVACDACAANLELTWLELTWLCAC